MEKQPAEKEETMTTYQQSIQQFTEQIMDLQGMASISKALEKAQASTAENTARTPAGTQEELKATQSAAQPPTAAGTETTAAMPRTSTPSSVEFKTWGRAWLSE
jgi:hypothetical protein